MEKRSIRSEYTNEGNRLVGYAAVYNSPSKIFERGKTFIETIAPGAFKRSLATNKDILCCFNHDMNRILGRTSSGTLQLSEDSHGLRFSVDLPDTNTGREVRELVSRGDLQGASFTFGMRSGGDKWNGDQRTILDLDLVEVSPVVTPAYKDTELALRMSNELACKYRYRLMLMERI